MLSSIAVSFQLRIPLHKILWIQHLKRDFQQPREMFNELTLSTQVLIVFCFSVELLGEMSSLCKVLSSSLEVVQQILLKQTSRMNKTIDYGGEKKGHFLWHCMKSD